MGTVGKTRPVVVHELVMVVVVVRDVSFAAINGSVAITVVPLSVMLEAASAEVVPPDLGIAPEDRFTRVPSCAAVATVCAEAPLP